MIATAKRTIWNIKETAERLGVGRSTIEAWVKNGKIPFLRMPTRDSGKLATRFDSLAIEEWLDSMRVMVGR